MTHIESAALTRLALSAFAASQWPPSVPPAIVQCVFSVLVSQTKIQSGISTETVKKGRGMRWRTQRWVVDFPTKVSTEQNSSPLNISSVSTSGAKLHGAHDLKEGDRIRVSCLTDQIYATVVWVTHDECGIEFSCPIGQRQLSSFRKPGGTGSAAWAFVRKKSNVHGFREL